MIRAVLDANVIVSAAYTFEQPMSDLANALRAGIRGRYMVVTSDHIMSEVRLALAKPFFVDRLSPEFIGELLDDLKQAAKNVSIEVHVHGVATHWQDDLVLATALSGQADYLVTGDRELLALRHPYSFDIIHPNQFLPILEYDVAHE